jgi:hypothetical protein
VNSPAAPSGLLSTGPVHREQNYQINWDHPTPAFRGAAALSAGGAWHAASFGPLAANTWYHLAATYDGQALLAYKDGVLVTTNEAPSGNPSPETASLKLGRHALSPTYFRGTIDDVQIYDVALTAQQVQQAMLGAPLEAGAIAVENFSFELPGTVKIKGWNGEGAAGTPAVDIPGWRSDTAAADSSVETGWTPTDGLWTAFVKAGDPAVWQLTNHTIAAGEVFELKVDARITGGATMLLMVLYYDNAGVRIPAAIQGVPLTQSMQEYTVTFNAAQAPACVGKKIGIEFTNVSPSTPANWLGIDNVRLSLVQ